MVLGNSEYERGLNIKLNMMSQKYVRCVWLISLILLSVSCVKKDRKMSCMLSDNLCRHINVDLKSDDYIDLDSIMELVGFIKLESNQNCFIGKVEKLIITDNEVIIADKSIARAVYVFNLDGTFRTKISQQGRGPQEYLEISDVFMMNDNSEISVLDNENNRIVSFDCYGKFLYSIKNLPWYHAVESIDTCTLIGFDLSNTKKLNRSFVVQDLYGRVNYTFGNNSYSDGFSYSRKINLYRFYDGIYGSVNFENTIYRFTKDSVYASYKINTTPPIIDGSDFKTDESFKDKTKKSGHFNGEFLNMKQYVLFEIMNLNFGHSIYVYDKMSDTTTKIRKVSDNPIMSLWSFPLACTGDNKCCSVIMASNACGSKGALYEQFGSSQTLDLFYSELTSDSNPIILITKIVNKDF